MTPLRAPAAPCAVCGEPLDWPHDHLADNTGLDDGPLIRAPRKKMAAKSAEEWHCIRARAWATRREKYGPDGHR